jgi:hypothetical protein
MLSWRSMFNGGIRWLLTKRQDIQRPQSIVE